MLLPFGLSASPAGQLHYLTLPVPFVKSAFLTEVKRDDTDHTKFDDLAITLVCYTNILAKMIRFIQKSRGVTKTSSCMSDSTGQRMPPLLVGKDDLAITLSIISTFSLK